MATGNSEHEQKSTDRIPELLLDFAKVRYRKEMEKLAILPRSMEARELLEHHEMAVHLALEIVTETRPLTKEQKQHVKGILDTMFSSYEELNLKKKKAPGPAIGIDLGTTFSCVAVYRNEKEAEIVPSSTGRNKIPSYVAYPTNDEEDSDDEGDGEPYFGDTAKDEAPNNQKGTIYDVKRMLGRKFNDPRIRRDREFWPFDILDNNGEIEIKTPQGPASPLEVTTELLKHLKGLADNFVGNDVLSAVVAVPAYYSPQQRELIKTACHKAGLNVLQLVNEPIAAAVAYNFHKPPQEGQKIKHCLIFDFGGGTFDVAVLSIISNKIHVKTVGGDAHLGGQDIDNNMVNYCLEQFKLQHDVDLKAKQNSENAKEQSRVVSSIRRLKKECEIQKCFLSQTGMQTISVDSMHGSTDLVVQMTKATFNSINNQIFQSCIKVMAKILEDSQIPKEDIDEVVMVGGSCRIPRIGELVSEFFGGKQLCRSIDADEAVAVGAAVLAFHAEHVDLPNVLVQEQEPIFERASGDRSTDIAKSTHNVHTNSMGPRVEHGQRTLMPFYLAPIHLEPLRGHPKTQGGLGYAIGIDLGLTYASIAIFNNSQVTILTNDCGRLKTPCFVIPDEDYSITNPWIIVGNSAKEQRYAEPENTIYDAKLMIGRNYEDPVIQTHMKQWPFKIIDEDGAALIQMRDRSYRPEEVTAMLLRYLKEQAERYLGGPVTHAVLTVPAHFKESQRTATKMAGEIAGLKILQILNEPTAAAIAYHQQVLQSCLNNKPKHLLIFDLGTKMFDLTLQTIDNGIVTTHAIDGDLHLGGNDFIDGTVQYCIQEFEKKHNVDLSSSHTLEATTPQKRHKARPRQIRLRNECKQRINNISSAARVTIISLECFCDDIDLNVILTRETFNLINQQLFDKITLTLDRLMTNVPELQNKIKDVILIGEFTRYPKFEELLQSYFGDNLSIHRIDEAVAHGAAIYASQLTQLSPTVLTTFLPKIRYSLGVRVITEERSIFVPECDYCIVFVPNVNFPCKRTLKCFTAFENQSSFLVDVYEFDNCNPMKPSHVAQFHLRHLPPNCAKGEPVDVCIVIDNMGFLSVTAKCTAFEPQKEMSVEQRFNSFNPGKYFQ